MSAGRVPATRLALVRARQRLDRVERGASVLRRKREALVAELFGIARPAVDARKQIAERASQAFAALLEALAARGEDGIRTVAAPARAITVELAPGQVWGVPVTARVARSAVARSLPERGTSPAGAGLASGTAANEFETLVELLLDAAPREMLLRRLGDALARTSREVHTLERRVGPELAARIGAARRTLEEREREERYRLKHLVARRRGATR